MNTDDFRSRIDIQRSGYGRYEVTIEYRGKFYKCTSHNSLAYDRIIHDCDIPEKAVKEFYTYKDALKALWDECKRENNL